MENISPPQPNKVKSELSIIHLSVSLVIKDYQDCLIVCALSPHLGVNIGVCQDVATLL